MKLVNNKYYVGNNLFGIYIQKVDKIAYIHIERPYEYLKVVSPKEFGPTAEADNFTIDRLLNKRLKAYAASFEKSDIDKTIL